MQYNSIQSIPAICFHVDLVQVPKLLSCPHSQHQVMWLLGKIFWALAILPPLAEAWHPGLLGSWLMIPAIFAVIYGRPGGSMGVLFWVPNSKGEWQNGKCCDMIQVFFLEDFDDTP